MLVGVTGLVGRTLEGGVNLVVGVLLEGLAHALDQFGGVAAVGEGVRVLVRLEVNCLLDGSRLGGKYSVGSGGYLTPFIW